MTTLNSRPPHHAVALVNFQAKRHRTHFSDTEEEMVSLDSSMHRRTQPHAGDQVPLFDKDTNGSKPQSHYIMPRRNWCSISLIPTGELLFDIRVEKEKGHGETVG